MAQQMQDFMSLGFYKLFVGYKKFTVKEGVHPGKCPATSQRTFTEVDVVAPFFHLFRSFLQRVGLFPGQ